MVSVSHVTALLATLQLYIGHCSAMANNCGIGKGITCGSVKLSIDDLKTAVGKGLTACTKDKTRDCSCSGSYKNEVIFALNPRKPQVCLAEAVGFEGATGSTAGLDACVCDS